MFSKKQNILASAGAHEITLTAFCRQEPVEAFWRLLSRETVFLTNAIVHDQGSRWFFPILTVPDFSGSPQPILQYCCSFADMCNYMPADLSLLPAEFMERCQHLGELTGLDPHYIVRLFYVAQKAKIHDTTRVYVLPESSVIQRFNGELSFGRNASTGFLTFCGSYDAPEFFLERRMLPNGKCALLPVAFFFDCRAPNQVFHMYEMPESEVLPLLHSEAVRARQDCTVEISSELAVAACTPAVGTQIAVGWYGGWETWGRVDLSVLSGHPLILRCNDQPEALPATRYRNTATMLERLSNHDRKVQIRMLDDAVWNAMPKNGIVSGSATGERLLTPSEFAEEAQQYGVICKGVVPKVRLQSYSMDELLAVPSKEFVVYPVLKEGHYVLIYGGTGVAKTWFALHLAIALTQGCSPFPQWECRSKPLNVLYAAGEMDRSTYGERLKMLLADQKTNPRFQLIRENLDLTSSEDQERVYEFICDHRSRVVFLDNLSTLTTNGHFEGQFEKFRRFIGRLTAEGIIVLLIHHENREGRFRGSGKIELVSDQSLHLFATGKGDKIELLVQAEKIRMTARNEQQTFRTEFDPKRPSSVWPVFPLTDEERRRLNEDDPLDEVGSNVGKKRNNQQLAWRYLDDDERAIAIINDMLTGCLDDVTAANLAVRQRAVAEFKCRNGISEETLRSHLPAAKKKAERDQGDCKPSALAPILWAFLKMESQR